MGVLDNHVDAMLREVFLAADAGKLEHLGCFDGAAGKDDFFLGEDCVPGVCAVDKIDACGRELAGGIFSLAQDKSLDQSVCDDV